MSSTSDRIFEGIHPPAPDICKGWNLRNRANNLELSGLVPAAHLYAVMDKGEVEDLVTQLTGEADPGQIGARSIRGRRQRVTFNYYIDNTLDHQDIFDPVEDAEAFSQKVVEINEQLTKDLVQANVTYPFKNADNSSHETITTYVVPIAEMRSQTGSGAYGGDEETGDHNAYSGVGINDVSTQVANVAGLNRRVQLSITFSDAHIIDKNYAYQKLLALNTKYFITYGWYNGGGDNTIFGTNTREPEGDSADSFMPYPVVRKAAADSDNLERQIDLDCTMENTGGFFAVQRMVLSSFNFNVNDLGQLEGNFTFIDETAQLLSQTSVAAIAPIISKFLKSGETLSSDALFGAGANELGGFLGEHLAAEIDENQTKLANGLRSVLSGIGGERIGNYIDDLKASENESIFGDPMFREIVRDEVSNYVEKSFPFSGPGVVQYEVFRRPISSFLGVGDAEDTDVKETIYTTEYQSKINFYYLGWLTETIRYALAAQSDRAGRESYVNRVEDVEKFGVNFFYEALPENSLFTMQYQRLLENTQLNDVQAVTRKIMSYIEEVALPGFDESEEYQQFANSGGQNSLGGVNAAMDMFNFPISNVASWHSATIRGRQSQEVDKIMFKKQTFGEYAFFVYEHRSNDGWGDGAVAPWDYFREPELSKNRTEIEYGRLSGWALPRMDPEYTEKLHHRYGHIYDTPGYALYIHVTRWKHSGGQWITDRGWLGHLWFPADKFGIDMDVNASPGSAEPQPSGTGYLIDAFRYMLDPQLFVNTMKKWWIEHRKALLKDIQEKVIFRLQRLEAEGKTILDILNEPIDLEWLTSRQVELWQAEEMAGAGALRAQFFQRSEDEEGYVGQGEPEAGKNKGVREPSQHNDLDGWRRWHYAYNTDRHTIWNLEAGNTAVLAGRDALKRWDPYRLEIPDISNDPLAPTIELLKLLWDSRAVDGRKDVNNYGPDAGGLIYDKIMNQGFVPENIDNNIRDFRENRVPDSGHGHGRDPWAQPLQDTQREMLELFNQSVDTPHGEQNILDILKPGFTGIDTANALSRRQVEENEHLEAEIDIINEIITERVLFSVVVSKVMEAEYGDINQEHQAHTDWQETITFLLTIKSNFDPQSFIEGTNMFPYLMRRREYNQKYSSALTSASLHEEDSTRGAPMPPYLNIIKQILDTTSQEGSADSVFALINEEILRHQELIENVEFPNIKVSIRQHIIDYMLAPDASGVLAEDVLDYSYAGGTAAANKIYASWNLTSDDPGFNPDADTNNDGVINALDLEHYVDFNRSAGWKLMSNIISRATSDDISAQFWFNKVNNDYLTETNGGILQEKLTYDQYSALFQILYEANMSSINDINSLKSQRHEGIGPADISLKIREALIIIGDYFRSLRGSQAGHAGAPGFRDTEIPAYTQGYKPPVFFYLDWREDGSQLITKASYNPLLSLQRESRFEILYYDFPGWDSGEGYRIGQGAHDLGLTSPQKEALVRNTPVRNSIGDATSDYMVKRNPTGTFLFSNTFMEECVYELTGDLTHRGGANITWTYVAVPIAGMTGYWVSTPGVGDVSNHFTPVRTIGKTSRNGWVEDKACYSRRMDAKGLGKKKNDYHTTVFGYVGQMDGIGHLTESSAAFLNFIDRELYDKDSFTAVIGQDSFFGDFLAGGQRINKKYANFMVNMMALAPGNRRIIIRKKQRFDEDSTSNDLVDPTYGDAVGYFTGATTYGDIRGKVPKSTAEIAIRRDVIDNMLRPSNHRMNLLDFINIIASPVAIAAIGGQATLTIKNLMGVLSIAPESVTQDSYYEDYNDMVIDAVENQVNAFDEFMGQHHNDDSAANLNKTFYVFYKKNFSLVQNVSLAAKVDPAYVEASRSDKTKFFEGGLGRNFAAFLGWGNTANEFKAYVTARTKPGTPGSNSDNSTALLRFPEGKSVDDLISINEDDGDYEVTVDATLLEALPRTFISEFLTNDPDRQSRLVQFYLSEHAADINSVYKHYLKRVTLTIHGTANLTGFTQIYLDNILPGLKGIFQIISVNEKVDANGFQTILECAMRWAPAPEDAGLDPTTGQTAAEE